MFPSRQHHQEVARERHADFLRAARREQLASVVTAERERSPIVRLGRLLRGTLPTLLRRREAHVGRPAQRAL